MEYLDYLTYYYILLVFFGIIALWFKAEQQVEDFIIKENRIKKEYAFLFKTKE